MGIDPEVMGLLDLEHPVMGPEHLEVPVMEPDELEQEMMSLVNTRGPVPPTPSGFSTPPSDSYRHDLELARRQRDVHALLRNRRDDEYRPSALPQPTYEVVEYIPRHRAKPKKLKYRYIVD